MESRAEYLIYYILADIPDSQIKEEALEGYIYDATPSMHTGNYGLHYLVARKIVATRIICKKLTEGRPYLNRELAEFTDVCIDCLLYTPPEFYDLTMPARSAVRLILSFSVFEVFEDILKEKVSPFFDDVIRNPNLLMSEHHRNLIELFFSYSHKIAMSYKTQIVSLLRILFNQTFDYKPLWEYIEFFASINLVTKNCRKKDQLFLLFKVNDEGSCRWEVIWEVHFEELLTHLTTFVTSNTWKFNVHQININLIILTSLLQTEKNIGFVEICLDTFKILFIEILHFVTKTIECDAPLDPIVFFLSIVLLFIDVFVKVTQSNYYVLFEYISEILYKIYPYGFRVKNFLLLTNCLSVLETLYGVVMILDKTYTVGFWIRSKTVIFECAESLQIIKNLLSSRNTNIFVIQNHCADTLHFLEEREKYIAKLFKILVIHMNSNALIGSVISIVVTFANNLVGFVNFCYRWLNLTIGNNECLRCLGKSISMFLSDVLKRNLLPQYYNGIPMTEFISLYAELNDNLSLQHTFNIKTEITNYTAEYSDHIHYRSNGGIHPEQFKKIEMEPQKIKNCISIPEVKPFDSFLISHGVAHITNSDYLIETDNYFHL